MKHRHHKHHRRHRERDPHKKFPIDLVGSLVAIAVLIFILIRFVLPRYF